MMESEIKVRYVNPEEPLHEGMQNRKWVNKEELKVHFPDQSGSKNPEDFCGTQATLFGSIITFEDGKS